MKRNVIILFGVLAMLAGLTTATAQAQLARDILVMGSSTTGCAGPSAPAKCYVNIIDAALPTDNVTTLARPGTYVAYGTPTQNWTTTPIPSGQEIVIIQLGINDWYVPVAPATYRIQLTGTVAADGADGLLTRVRAANPTARIYWLSAWMPAYGAYLQVRQDMWQDHGEVTAAAVNAVGGVMIDVDPTGDRRASAPYRADATGWHYNDAGHLVLAKRVLDLIG